ncbi:LuxR C-terminal-related transcriptional regulator [Streptomyces pinistramenti]|uniref:LuxR C-terminal-related transcriptional regulator n=1 Tax=Streptomyces pinistramenti TaxID=2884812 RepID=UPI001D072C75|nr:LuxR C-terminal-related transcriptional regulator [Streptomyces pinistramenti]MCB5911969.1 LuxR C-terminal-related transcriptional regulator [Streptomyces pinistramenti]
METNPPEKQVPRHIGIVHSLALGRSPVEISIDLGISQKALEGRVQRLCERYQVRDRATLVLAAHRHGHMNSKGAGPRRNVHEDDVSHLRLAADGASISDIAAELQLSIAVVQARRARLLRRMEAENMLHAVHLGCCWGYLT